MPALLVSFAVLVFMVVTLVDIIRIDDSRARFLPKIVWMLLAILLPFIGSMLWWAMGREYNGDLQIRRPAPRQRRAPRTSAPAPAPQTYRPIDTRSTEQQIADLDREIEEWRLREEIAKRKQAKESGEADS